MKMIEAENKVFLKYFLITSIVYGTINFIFTPNSLSPLHQDDYEILGAGFENLNLFIERPVSTNLAYLMGQMGLGFSFVLVNILTALMPAMILYFYSIFLRLNFGLILVAAYSVMVFSHAAALEHGKYLGLETNLTSHFFGCLTLIFLVNASIRQSTLQDALAVIAYGLSVFAKEDFILPPLLLIIYFGVSIFYTNSHILSGESEDKGLKKKWLVKMSLSFAVVLAASNLFSSFVKNPFLAGLFNRPEDMHTKVGSYDVSFDPLVLLDAFERLTLGYCPWQTIAGSLAFIILIILWRVRRLEVALLVAITFSLIIPYALIFNRILEYRVFSWLPWLSAPVIVLIYLLSRGVFSLKDPAKGKVLAALIILIPFLIGYLDSPHRLGVAGWYAEGQNINKEIINSLISNKTLLNQEPVVGIIGVEGLSPWTNIDGAYLRKKLGFSNNWLIFVTKSTPYNTVQDADPMVAPVVVSLLEKVCDRPELLVLKFDPSGAAILTKAQTLCTQN